MTRGPVRVEVVPGRGQVTFDLLRTADRFVELFGCSRLVALRLAARFHGRNPHPYTAREAGRVRWRSPAWSTGSLLRPTSRPRAQVDVDEGEVAP